MKKKKFCEAKKKKKSMNKFFFRKINSLFFNLCKRKIGEEKKNKTFFQFLCFFKKEKLLNLCTKKFCQAKQQQKILKVSARIILSFLNFLTVFLICEINVEKKVLPDKKLIIN